jgi:hypothetical protein
MTLNTKSFLKKILAILEIEPLVEAQLWYVAFCVFCVMIVAFLILMLLFLFK